MRRHAPGLHSGSTWNTIHKFPRTALVQGDGLGDNPTCARTNGVSLEVPHHDERDFCMLRRMMIALFGLAISLGATANDVTQFRGPERTGKFNESGLLKSWPEGGPPLLWSTAGFGVGFSSPLVDRGRIYVTGTLEGQESYVFVLDMDGKLVDKISYGVETDAATAPGARSTPTIVGDRMYLLSGIGNATCIDLPSKKILWQVNILERFQGTNNEWQLAESLLVDGDRVVCTPGGPEALLAALNKDTGQTVWATKGLHDMASYVTPVLVEHKGRRIILTETSKFLVCVDANSGELLWKHDHPTQYDIHGVTPIYHEGSVYYVAGYKSGGGLLKLSDDASSYTVTWTDDQLDCQHHGVILHDGYLYGTSHHRAGGQMTCLDWATGAVQWADKQITQAVTIFADGMLYTYEGPRRGIVSLVKPSRSGLERVGSFPVTAGTKEHWAHPIIAHGRLYVRHGDTLLCYDVKAK